MSLKWAHRIGYISVNAIWQITQPVFGFLIAYIVIKYNSKLVWGEFVSFLLFTFFVLQFVNWGNKEYLLRLFSKEPKNIKKNYTQILSVRFPLVIFASVTSFLFFDAAYFLLISIWLLGKFFTQSTVALVIYEKQFKTAIFIEFLCFLIFLLTIYCLEYKLNIYELVSTYSSYQLLKGLFYIGYNYNYLTFKNFKINWSFFKNAFPFFLLAILGFLTSKIDLYLIQFYSDEITTANYQVINALLLLVMSSTMFLYTPFIKNIYRIKSHAILKTEKLLMRLGLLLVPLSIVLIYFICVIFYDIKLSFSYITTSVLLIYPTFIYGVLILWLFKNNHEKIVVNILAIASFINLILTLVLLNLNLGILGALIGSTISQFVILFLIKYQTNKLTSII